MKKLIMKIFGREVHYCNVYDRKTGKLAGHINRYLKTKNFQSSDEERGE